MAAGIPGPTPDRNKTKYGIGNFTRNDTTVREKHMTRCQHNETSPRCIHCGEPTCGYCRCEKIVDRSITVCDACFEELNACPCCGAAGFDFEERHGSCLSGCEVEARYYGSRWDSTDCRTHHRTLACNEP